MDIRFKFMKFRKIAGLISITLSIGIVTSMFTAIMCTRAMVNLVYGNKNIQELKI